MESVWVGVRYIAAVPLFALCGYLSAANLLSSPQWHFPNVPLWGVFPLPFALLCCLYFMHTIRAALAAPAMLGVWCVSLWTANLVGILVPANSGVGALLPGGVGGFVGGLGLSLCTAICYPSLLSSKRLYQGGLVGLICGLSFTPWVGLYEANLNSFIPGPPIFPFAIWQAAMGTYLCVIYTEAGKAAQPGDSEQSSLNLL